MILINLILKKKLCIVQCGDFWNLTQNCSTGRYTWHNDLQIIQYSVITINFFSIQFLFLEEQFFDLDKSLRVVLLGIGLF